jgi:hypothetical protein
MLPQSGNSPRKGDRPNSRGLAATKRSPRPRLNRAETARFSPTQSTPARMRRQAAHTQPTLRKQSPPPRPLTLPTEQRPSSCTAFVDPWRPRALPSALIASTEHLLHGGPAWCQEPPVRGPRCTPSAPPTDSRPHPGASSSQAHSPKCQFRAPWRVSFRPGQMRNPPEPR